MGHFPYLTLCHEQHATPYSTLYDSIRTWVKRWDIQWESSKFELNVEKLGETLYKCSLAPFPPFKTTCRSRVDMCGCVFRSVCFRIVLLSRHLSLTFIFCRGNWGVDLEAGSNFGYRLLFVILLAGLFAIFLQVLL